MHKSAQNEGGEVAGYENIKDANSNRTPRERRELAKRAGKASGEARRRKADFQKTLNMLLTAEIDSEEWKPILEALGVECTLESALNMAMIKEGLAGNVKAYEAIAKYAGQNGRTDTDLAEQAARIQLLQAQKEDMQKVNPEKEETPYSGIPALMIAPVFAPVLFDIQEHKHMEYVFPGGRGSTKSSFVSLNVIDLIMTHRDMHAVVMRQVADTMRGSVYQQILWAIVP